MKATNWMRSIVLVMATFGVVGVVAWCCSKDGW